VLQARSDVATAIDRLAMRLFQRGERVTNVVEREMANYHGNSAYVERVVQALRRFRQQVNHVQYNTVNTITVNTKTRLLRKKLKVRLLRYEFFQ